MSALRFKQGDMAVLAVARSAKSQMHVGKQGTIERVGPMAAGDTFYWHNRWCVVDGPGDYIWTCGDDVTCGVVPMDWQLRKIGEQAEPASLTRESESEVVA